LGGSAGQSKDILIQAYKYFLEQFGEKRAGEFYTPQPMVKLPIAIIEPYKGRIYNPCCDFGRVFVQSEKFVERVA
jgi:type I restriction enzyme M protein